MAYELESQDEFDDELEAIEACADACEDTRILRDIFGATACGVDVDDDYDGRPALLVYLAEGGSPVSTEATLDGLDFQVVFVPDLRRVEVN